MVTGMKIEIVNGQSWGFFSNEPFEKKPVITILDFDFHSDDYLGSQLFRNGMCVHCLQHVHKHPRKHTHKHTRANTCANTYTPAQTHTQQPPCANKTHAPNTHTTYAYIPARKHTQKHTREHRNGYLVNVRRWVHMCASVMFMCVCTQTRMYTLQGGEDP